MAHHLAAPGSDCRPTMQLDNRADAEFPRQAGIPPHARALIVAVTARPRVRRSGGTVQRRLQPLLNTIVFSTFWRID